MDFIGEIISGTFGLIFDAVWLILVIYALISIFRSGMNTNTKILWLVIILVIPVIGSLLYIFWGRNQSFL